MLHVKVPGDLTNKALIEELIQGEAGSVGSLND